MFATLSPTEVAFALIAVMQTVLALVWWIGGWWAREMRRAVLHWSGYAALSALSFALLVLAMRSAQTQPGELLRAELLRAAGNVAGVVALMALRRGIWVFLGRSLSPSMQPLLLGAVLVIAWLGLDPALGALRVGFNSLVLTWLCLDIARALHTHARDALQFRWPLMLSLPVLFAALGYAMRGARALLDPASVAAAMTTHSALNVGSAFSYVVLALALNAMLTVLVVAHLFAQLRLLSHRDGLTGLLNRRAMQEALDTQMRRSRRNGEAFVLMMLDADHFKAINDQHGHAVGDRVLKHLSALLHSGMREIDRLARFGGEEFLVLLPGVTLTEAVPVAERLRALVVNTPLADGGTPIAVSVSVSIGLAEWAGADEDLSRLLVRADAALYQAKQRGRDRVALAEAPAPALLTA
jgi:diguanylate cyclase (GGDEF)-like protein